MTLVLELQGLEVYGPHGVLEKERREGVRLLVDVSLDVPDDPASTDRIEDAVDYREVAAAVREVADARSFHLLEALAVAVAEALLERFPVERARVRVRKPDVELAAAPVSYAAVTAERSR